MADVLVVYDSRTGNTEAAAHEIAEGVKEAGATVEVKKVQDAGESDVEGAKSLILGSYCINDNYSGGLREFLDNTVANARHHDKFGAAFGTHKWKGGNLPKLEKDMVRQGLSLIAPGVNAHMRPNAEDTAKLRSLGKVVGMAAGGKKQ